jgi:hypothetical protein
MDTYPGQPQPPTHIRGKSINLRTARPYAPECGSSRTMMVDPFFRTKLPKYALGPPHFTQILIDSFEPFTHMFEQLKGKCALGPFI